MLFVQNATVNTAFKRSLHRQSYADEYGRFQQRDWTLNIRFPTVTGLSLHYQVHTGCITHRSWSPSNIFLLIRHTLSKIPYGKEVTTTYRRCY
jgi:hypothetical protein